MLRMLRIAWRRFLAKEDVSYAEKISWNRAGRGFKDRALPIGP